MTTRTESLFTAVFLIAGLAAAARAAPVFEVPAGCTAIQPSAQVTGVQCYGSNTSIAGQGYPSLAFNGAGSGPLWADQVTFEWDFLVDANGLGSIPVVMALVNGTSGQHTYPRYDLFSKRYTGSLTLPYTPGQVLSSWSILASSIQSVSGSSTLSTPLDGVGFRLLANHQPLALAAVPEPGTAALSVLALACCCLAAGRRS